MKNYLSLFGGQKPLVVENWLPRDIKSTFLSSIYILTSKGNTDRRIIGRKFLILGWRIVRVYLSIYLFIYLFIFVALSFTTDSNL